MTAFELYMDFILGRVGKQRLKDNEQWYIIQGSVLSAIFAATITNCLEVAVIR